MQTPQVEKYELWRPVLRPERRQTLENLHRAVGTAWWQALFERLNRGASIALEGTSFESFRRLCETQSGDWQVFAFTAEGPERSGVVLIDRELGRAFVEERLGGGSDRPEGDKTFTMLEAAIADELAGLIIDCLSSTYASAGLGPLTVKRHRSRLADLLVFRPEDHLIVFRYSVGGLASHGRIVVGVDAAVVNVVPAETGQRDRLKPRSRMVEESVHGLPVEAEVVLGTWMVPIAEVLQLRPGDLVALPGVDEGVLTVGGERLHLVETAIEPQGIGVRILRDLKDDEKKS